MVPDPMILALAGLTLVNLGLLLLLVRRGGARSNERVAIMLEAVRRDVERGESSVSGQLARSREENILNARQLREELAGSLKSFNDSVLARMADLAGLQRSEIEILTRQLAALTTKHEEKLEGIRRTVEEKLQLIQEDNAYRLEQMRATVDEKLSATLEQRLGDSFRLVSERLELVHQGLGEMQTLATGVGDLKRVLTNVKTRGTWGETQLGNIIEQILTPDQYATNVATKKDSTERVEFAIKIPAKDHTDRIIWLPIDAKFPLEDYQRLLDAQERCEAKEIEACRKALGNRIKAQAKDIREKYISSPETTDFALLFLPTEGLYAEVLSQAGLFEAVQRDYKVVITGPTSLAAVIHSLQIGFRTLAIEKRSSEIWALLGAVKTEFGRFGDILEKTQKKLAEASNSIEDATRKSRTIERRLRSVQELPLPEGMAAAVGELGDA